MFGFIVVLLLGFCAKMAYDFFQEERIPTDLGMAQGRAEAIMDETRQIVREIRDELRSGAAAAQASLAEKAERLQSAAEGTAGSQRAAGAKSRDGSRRGSANSGGSSSPRPAPESAG